MRISFLLLLIVLCVSLVLVNECAAKVHVKTQATTAKGKTFSEDVVAAAGHPDWSKWSYVLGRQAADGFAEKLPRSSPSDESFCSGVRDAFTNDSEPLYDESERTEVYKRARTPLNAGESRDSVALEDPAISSYAYGFEVGVMFGPSKRNWSLEITVLCSAFSEVLRSQPNAIDDSEWKFINEQMSYDYKLYVFRRKTILNAEKNEVWLEGIYKQSKTIRKTADGLYYEILKRGTSEQRAIGRPLPTDRVLLHVKAKTKHGEVYSDTYENGIPKQYDLAGKLLQGWRLALTKHMYVGDSLRLYLHPDLAYGTSGFQKIIQPGQACIHEIELVDIITTTTPAKEEL